MDNILYFIPSAGILALLFVYLKNNWVASKEVGSEKMGRIAKNIADGAMAFLRAEYKILSVFVILTAILLGFKGVSEGTSYLVGVSFVVGAAKALVNAVKILKSFSANFNRVDLPIPFEPP